MATLLSIEDTVDTLVYLSVYNAEGAKQVVAAKLFTIISSLNLAIPYLSNPNITEEIYDLTDELAIARLLIYPCGVNPDPLNATGMSQMVFQST